MLSGNGAAIRVRAIQVAAASAAFVLVVLLPLEEAARGLLGPPLALAVGAAWQALSAAFIARSLAQRFGTEYRAVPIFRSADALWMMTGIAGGLALVPASAWLNSFVVPRLTVPAPGPADAWLASGPGQPGARAAFICLAVSTMAYAEETVFRGLLFVPAEKESIGQTLAWTTAAFVVIHFSLDGAPQHLLAGLAFGLVRALSGSVWAAVGMHAAFNTLVWLSRAGLT